jgi:imidazolonepropionase-like amidohydrolase
LPASTATTWIRCAGYFSARGHDQLAWIGVAHGVIAAIATKLPDNSALILDAPPLYAVPLLSDTHVHVYMEPWPVAPSQRAAPGDKDFESEVTDAMRRVDEALASGVGLLRDMGDPHGINIEVQRRLKQRSAPAPELIIAGPGFHRPKKYGRFLGVCRETAREICASIDELHRQNQIDFVKVVTTGIVDFAQVCVKQSPQFTVDELREVVDHAHELGYKVASHCSGADGVDINLAAGVDFIEHAYFVREDQIDRMAEQGTAWTPTLAPVHVQGEHSDCGWPAEVRRNIDAILDEHVQRIAYGISKGVRILAGTDAGCPGVSLGGGIQIELKRFAAAGISAEALLQMATASNAGAIGAKDYSPTIEAGAPASFALYERCPWSDVTNLNSLRHVFVRGEQIR